MLKNKPSF